VKPLVGAVRTVCFAIIGFATVFVSVFNKDLQDALGVKPEAVSKVGAIVAGLAGIATFVVRQLEDKGKVTSLGRNQTLPPPIPPPPKDQGAIDALTAIVVCFIAVLIVVVLVRFL